MQHRKTDEHHRLVTALAIVALPASCALAQDKPAADAPRSESFETVKKEFLDARKAYSTEMRAAYEEAEGLAKEN